LFLLIGVHIIRGIARQLGEPSNILIHHHRALPQVLELFLFQLDHALGNVMSAESGPELLPNDALRLLMSIHIRIPPFRCRSLQLVRCKEHSFPDTTLYNLKLLLNRLQPVVCIHGFHIMRKVGRLSPLELTQLVSQLWLWNGLISVGILHGRHGLLHSLQHLHLHDQHLL
jgi:hypothetical protein